MVVRQRKSAIAAAFALVLLLAPFLCLRNTPAPTGQRVVASAAPAAELARRSSSERASRSVWRARDLEMAQATAPAPTVPPTTAVRLVASTPAPRPVRVPAPAPAIAPKPAPTPAPKPTPTTAPKAAPTTTRPAPTTTTAPPPPPPSHSQTGQASWYSGPDGECANNQAPMGTILRVTNLDTGRSTTCRVASRGPYVSGRVIDLTKTTFARIADPSAGVCRVRVEW